MIPGTRVEVNMIKAYSSKKFNKRIYNLGVLDDILKACLIHLIPSEVIEFPFKSKNSKAEQFCAKEGINKFRPYVLKAC